MLVAYSNRVAFREGFAVGKKSERLAAEAKDKDKDKGGTTSGAKALDPNGDVNGMVVDPKYKEPVGTEHPDQFKTHFPGERTSRKG